MKRLLMIPILLWSCGESPTPVNKVEQRTVTSTPVGKVERQLDRFALVIGNSAYQSVNPLKSPVKDAQDMTTTLKSIGFGQVTTLLNGSRKAMYDALAAVARQAKGQSVVVYYSGHGVQLEEENYLVPVDAPDPQTVVQAKTSCVSVNDVLSELHAAGCSPKILILDACRNNPFKGLGGGKAVGGKGGLAKSESKLSETYLAFATNPGEVAPDGNSSNENSPYTQVLLAELRKPNVQIEQTFKSVRAKLQDSGQTPWENTSLAREFVFFPQKTVAPAPIVVAPPVVVADTIAPAVPATPLPTTARKVFEPEMVSVQGGTFKMGSNDSAAESDEKPVHTVTLGNFSIGKYELTVGEFRVFISETSYKTDAEKEGKSYVYENKDWHYKNGVTWKCDIAGNVRPSNEENHPVIHVSWNDAVAYCNWLSQKTGKRYSLPTEAQWEYAARGGSSSKGYTYSGSNEVNVVAWYDGNSGSKTHSVGGKSANELGIYDISGNVWEWCSDWYGTYSSAAVTNPIGAATGVYRVLRGGSWGYAASHVRVLDRGNSAPANRDSNAGFRVVLLPS